jgi:phage-related minor tail protein
MTDTLKSLRQEIAALEHELRRVNDGLERNRTHLLEQRARQLRDNIALCRAELDRLNNALQSPVNSP